MAHEGPLAPGEIAFQQEIQDGMVTRSQLEALGASHGDIERWLRRRELVRVSPGVFVNHTGELTWIQRAWAAIMHAWPAALTHESVWKQTAVIHVAVGADRSLDPLPGVRWHRTRGFTGRVNWHLSPPRLHIEHAALEAASDASDEFGAVGVLTDVAQQRLTTFDDLAETLAGRSRLARGRWMREVLLDLAEGTNSVLEHEYLVRVERPHGLPGARRQHPGRVDGRRVERDVRYDRYRLYVELDGKTFHEGARARDRDLDRDLAAAVLEDARTVRLGWGQVLDRACQTAGHIGALLRRGGWPGRFRTCPACPPE